MKGFDATIEAGFLSGVESCAFSLTCMLYLPYVSHVSILSALMTLILKTLEIIPHHKR